MQYISEREEKNYQDFASGRVLYNQKGATAFPVRLASEVFLRSKAYLAEKGHDAPITIYDPFCGGAYLLTVLGFLHGKYLAGLIASDIDANILSLARRNLALLTEEGLEKRIEEIKNNLLLYGKESHKEALESALRLKILQADIKQGLQIRSFQADAGKVRLPDRGKVDLVLTDLPYGQITEWSSDGGKGGGGKGLEAFLDNIGALLQPKAILAIISVKEQKIEHKSYKRIKHFTIGKRRVSFLELK